MEGISGAGVHESRCRRRKAVKSPWGTGLTVDSRVEIRVWSKNRTQGKTGPVRLVRAFEVRYG
jgi:hypothetical protein